MRVAWIKLAVIALVGPLTVAAQNRPVAPVGRITDTNFAGNLAASVQGTLPFRPVRFPPLLLLGGGYGGYGYSGWADPSAYAPPVMLPPPVALGPPHPDAPEAVATPTPPNTDDNPVKIYSTPVAMAPPDGVSKPPAGNQVVILAFKDGGVETAIAYWTDGDQLKYVTPDRKQKQIALAKVDASLSTRLNGERGVAFSLGKPE